MTWYHSEPLEDEFVRMPKVDLHRHLEGSLRLDTMLELTREQGVALPDVSRWDGDLGRLVQVQADDPRTVANFLEKFKYQRPFYNSPETIDRLAYEAVADAADDGVRLLDLRFTPSSLARTRGFATGEVMDWVLDAVERAGRERGVITTLIASANRHDPLEMAEAVVRAAVERRERGIVGIDLAGDEGNFPAGPFLGLFREARQSGLRISIHAGEWAGPENVRQAIEVFEAERIGHGVRVLEDAGVTALARERGVPFEVCLTSNVQTGVSPTLERHPVRDMLAAGLNVTLNSDDPGIQRIRLSDELRAANQILGIPIQALRRLVLAAAEASFIEAGRKSQLIAELQSELGD